MPNVGPAEIFVILIVALLVFGPDKLPEIGRQVGKAVREFRKMQATLREEVREVLEPRERSPEPPQLASPQPMGEPATEAERDADDGAPGRAEGGPQPDPETRETT